MLKILPFCIIFLIYFSTLSTSMNLLGYFGILLAFLLSTLGSIRGLSCISKSVSGASILVPKVGSKSFFGIVICETNFLTSGIIICFTMFFKLQNVDAKISSLALNQLFFIVGLITGLCSYASSISTGIICSAITFMDAKDPTLFFKLVAMMFFSGGIGILAFVFGFTMASNGPKMVGME